MFNFDVQPLQSENSTAAAGVIGGAHKRRCSPGTGTTVPHPKRKALGEISSNVCVYLWWWAWGGGGGREK